MLCPPRNRPILRPTGLEATMDPAFITPFIASIRNVFSTMMKLEVKIGDPHIKGDPGTSYDVSGIIGMSGDVVGSVVVSLPQPVAASIASRFLSTEIKVDSPDLSDAIGEIVNMISGNAKSMFGGSRCARSRARAWWWARTT